MGNWINRWIVISICSALYFQFLQKTLVELLGEKKIELDIHVNNYNEITFSDCERLVFLALILWSDPPKCLPNLGLCDQIRDPEAWGSGLSVKDGGPWQHL